MLVRSYGFSLEAGNAAVPSTALFDALQTNSGIQDESKSTPRRIYVDNSDAQFLRGLVVTIKDMKAFCELVEAAGKLVINVNQLKGQNKLMEFNFFLINKTNGLGIYQYYHQSCSPGTFASYLRKRYRSLCESLQNKEIERLPEDTSHAKEAAIRRKYKRALAYRMLVRKESLSKVLKKFTNIKSFQFEYAQLQSDQFAGVPIGPFVRTLTQRVSFKPKSGINAIADAIEATISRLSLSKGHINVIDTVGNDEVPLSVRLADIPENFGEQDYEVVSAKLDNLDLDAFSKHKILDELKYACTHTYKHVFMARVKN